MSLIAVARALHALAPAGIAAFEGEAPSTVAAPWLVTNLESPASQEGETLTTTAATFTWRVTVAAATSLQCLGWISLATAAWRNARVEVPGHNIGTLRGPEVTGPYKAGLTATDTNLRFQVAQLRFSVTISTL